MHIGSLSDAPKVRTMRLYSFTWFDVRDAHFQTVWFTNKKDAGKCVREDVPCDQVVEPEPHDVPKTRRALVDWLNSDPAKSEG